MPEIRRMRDDADDIAASIELTWLAMWGLIPEELRPGAAQRERRGRVRGEHLLATDPDGSWVVEDADGRIVGLAIAFVRDRRWLLSQLAVHPDHQGKRLGTKLLEAALTSAAGTVGGFIVSSQHPSAMGVYRRAGFALVPTLEAGGPLRPASIPSGLRSRAAVLPDDVAVIDAASRHVRGATHSRELEPLLAYADTLLIHDGGGWAAAAAGSPITIAAHDETVARDLLWSVFASGPRGASVHVGHLSAQQQWAIDVCLDAGLMLSPSGPLCVRGQLGAMTPYLPGGSFL